MTRIFGGLRILRSRVGRHTHERVGGGNVRGFCYLSTRTLHCERGEGRVEWSLFCLKLNQ